jgi:hypothetical protein
MEGSGWVGSFAILLEYSVTRGVSMGDGDFYVPLAYLLKKLMEDYLSGCGFIQNCYSFLINKILLLFRTIIQVRFDLRQPNKTNDWSYCNSLHTTIKSNEFINTNKPNSPIPHFIALTTYQISLFLLLSFSNLNT